MKNTKYELELEKRNITYLKILLKTNLLKRSYDFYSARLNSYIDEIYRRVNKKFKCWEVKRRK